MAAEAYFKNMDAKDPLFKGFEQINKDYKVKVHTDIVDAVKQGENFVVPERIRFRKENDFYLVNVRWANAFSIDTELAQFLINMQSQQLTFNIKDIPGLDSERTLIYLVFKDVVEPEHSELKEHLLQRAKTGCSINPFELPEAIII